MRKLFFTLLLVFCLFLLLIVEAKAQIDWKKPGPRPVGIGTAFVSTSTKEYSVFWNPAGLGGLQNIYLHFSYADFCKIDLNSYYASFITPLKFLGVNDYNSSFGIDWLAKKDPSNKLDFNYDQFHLAYGRLLNDRFRVGVSANLKGGWKCGMIYYTGYSDLNFATIIYNDDFIPDTTNEKHLYFRLGFSYKLLYMPILAVDYEPIEKNIYAGAEVDFDLKPSLNLALRAGTRFDLDKNKFVTATAGLTLKFDISRRAKMNLDFAYVGCSDEEKSGHGGATLEIEKAMIIPEPGWKAPVACPNKIILNWIDCSEEEDGFVIERSLTNNYNNRVKLAEVGPNEQKYEDFKVEPGNTYYYWIKAYIKPNSYSLPLSISVPLRPVAWFCNLKVFRYNVSALDTIKLVFGQASDASNSLDPSYCEQNDPLSNGIFDARFNIKLPKKIFAQSFIDFRNSSGSKDTLEIYLRWETNGNYAIRITWDKTKLSTLANKRIHLKTKSGPVDADMKRDVSCEISPNYYTDGNLIIEISDEEHALLNPDFFYMNFINFI